MAKLASLDDLLVHELQDIYNAEGQILKALPKMAKAATNPDLKAAFEEHRAQTEGQVKRLEQVFKLLGHPVKGKKCDGMAGLIEEGKKMLEAGRRARGPRCRPDRGRAESRALRDRLLRLRLHLCRDAGLRRGPRAAGAESGRRGDHRRAAHGPGGERDQHRGGGRLRRGRGSLPLTTGHARADAIRLGRRLPETRHLRAGGSGRIATFRLRAPTPGPDGR